MRSDRLQDDLIGQVLHDTYRITGFIAEGGMGAVYQAVHARLADKRFAIKLLHREVSRVPSAYARFRREAEIATKLGHPNIVDVLDFYETEDGQPYLVMEYLDGEDLAARLDRCHRLTPGNVALVMGQVGCALQVAHDRGIVHRDIKPENIYLVKSGEGGLLAKVLDFGISKIRHRQSVVTQDLSVLGTPHYMSPEQAEGEVHDIDRRTDIFALGVLCYQALSGVLPFNAPTMPGVIYKICHSSPRPVTKLVPELHEDVDRVLFRALVKQKQDRYPRVDLFVRDLATALAREKPVEDVQAGSERSSVFGHFFMEEEGAAGDRSMAAAEGEPPAHGESGDVRTPVRTIPLGQDEAVLSAAIEEERSHDSRAVSVPHQPALPSADPVPRATTLSHSVGEKGIGALPGFWHRRKVLLMTAAGLVATALVTGLVIVTSKGRPPAAPSSLAVEKGPSAADVTGPRVQPLLGRPAPARRSTPSGMGAASPKQIRITLQGHPAGAGVFLDGETRDDNPLVLPASGKRHRLAVRARGYHPEEQWITASASRTVRVKLRRRRPAAQGRKRIRRTPPPVDEPGKGALAGSEGRQKPDTVGKVSPDRQLPDIPPRKKSPASPEPKKEAPIFEEEL